jgi:L-seryl-tRNA(Ser) seleniumtransferase
MEKPHSSGAHQPALRDLPSVDYLLRHPAVAPLSDEFAREELALCVRAVLDERRERIRVGDAPAVDATTLALDIRRTLYERTRPRLRKVINATGIVLHTGLGRAPLADEAIEAIQDAAAGYCNLEIDLASGERGDRHEHLRGSLRELTGAEDALVVNNNAAATFLALNTLARGRGVIVSRGQLVEIGGSYRMPDIMAAAGCRMVEVGTTNRTHPYDYSRAIDSETAVLLRVHTSNYRVHGFTAMPTLAELVQLARSHSGGELLVIDDLGSGLLERPVWSGGRGDGHEWDEPTVRESVAAGCDLTLFSGDKLLGGPQAGILVGRSELIARVRMNPLTRTYRPDKLTLAALDATLRLHRDPTTLARRLPIFRMLGASLAQIEGIARGLANGISRQMPEAEVEVAADESFAGGGALPTIAFETWVVRVRLDSGSVERIAGELRQGETPIVCRIQSGRLVFDCRTLAADEADAIPAALAEAAADAR